jgi:hypothetical protein
LWEDFGVQTAIRQFSKLLITIEIVTSDCLDFVCGLLRSRTALVAENLFLSRQLVLFQERKERARQTIAADRFVFASPTLRLAWRRGYCQTCHLDQLASSGIPPVLALGNRLERTFNNFLGA